MRDERGRCQGALRPGDRPPDVTYVDLEDVPGYELDEIAHFFAIYKALEPGKNTVVDGWQGRAEADATVEECRRRYTRIRTVHSSWWGYSPTNCYHEWAMKPISW